MSNVVQFPEIVRYTRFEDALDRSSEWLEDARNILRARLLMAKGGNVVLPPDTAQDLEEGLRIIIGNLSAMRASLEPDRTCE